MSSDIVTQVKKPQTIGDLLVSKRKQLEKALPRHMSVDRLLRVCMTAIAKNPRLKESTAESLVGAVIQCSQLGLEPDPILGHVYLVPFRNRNKGTTEVQVIAGYKGYIELAHRSGRVSSISAHAVFEGDQFDYAFGLNERLVHIPARGQRGKLTDAYAVVTFKEGAKQFDVMDSDAIDAIRARSRSKDDGPWVTDYPEMAKKTVIRKLCKFIPMSPEMQKLVSLDEIGEKDIPQDNESLLDGLTEDPAMVPMEANGPTRISAVLPEVRSAESHAESADPESFQNFGKKT